MADAGNDVIHFMARQLPTFARLGALGHLDLQFVGVDEISGGHAKTPGGHLLDGTAPGIAVGVGHKAGFVFPALAGVAFAADAVHGDCKGFVCLFGD